MLMRKEVGLMKAKDYLLQATEIKIRLEAMAEQLIFLKSTAMYNSPQYIYARAKNTNSCNIHKNQERIAEVLDFEDEIKKKYDKLDEINQIINSLSNPLAHKILVKRYLGSNTWKEIAKAVYTSRSRIFEIHNEALAEIEEKINK
jgi:DNA-directed RNA polymerase specialized sigma subunit